MSLQACVSLSLLTESDQRQLLRSSESTVELIEAAEVRLFGLPSNWTSRYVLGGEDGVPPTLFLFGISGQ